MDPQCVSSPSPPLCPGGVVGYSTVEQRSFGPASKFYRTLPEFVVDYQTRGRLRDWVPVGMQRAGSVTGMFSPAGGGGGAERTSDSLK